MADPVAVKEKNKYERMWGLEKYHQRSPGMRHLEDALLKLSPKPGATIVDLGCGTGRVSAELKKRGFRVVAVDIAENAATEFDGHFVASPLWDLPAELGKFDYGFCADVMEHIPTDHVAKTLECISLHASVVYFQIANFVCHEGDEIGEHLHLTVKPIEWWKKELDKSFVVQLAVKNPKNHVFICKSRAF